MAHVVDKSNSEPYFDATNGYAADMKTNATQLHDYLTKFQNDGYYECDGTETEIPDMTMELNAVGELDDIHQQNQCHPQQESLSKNRKRKSNSDISLASVEPLLNDRRPFDPISRFDNTLDEHDHFLYSLAPELRKIDSKFTLHFRNEVHNLILKYQSMSTND